MSSILVLGASYGSLLATKLAMAGHRVCLVCSGPTAALIRREGTVVRFPQKEVRSGELRGGIDALTPDEARPEAFDLVVAAMQEAQYGEASVRRLMRRIAAARVPCMAIMNMPPPPYLRRIARIDADALQDCYAAAGAWAGFDPALVTLASPDPQAFRPEGEGKNVLTVGLPTNFKAAVFDDARATALLRGLAQDVEAASELPVKLKVHDSVFVPLAKWPMLVTGNYRCIQDGGMVPIREAVHGDIERSRAIYEWAMDLCCRLGAARSDLVPFEKYAQAAAGLLKPSSAARALFNGARDIERVDRLVHGISQQCGMVNEECRRIAERIDERLRANRMALEAQAA